LSIKQTKNFGNDFADSRRSPFGTGRLRLVMVLKGCAGKAEQPGFI
jgi:hypothetical protein